MLSLTININIARLYEEVKMPDTPDQPKPEKDDELDQKRREELAKALREHFKKHPPAKPDPNAIEIANIDVPPKAIPGEVLIRRKPRSGR